LPAMSCVPKGPSPFDRPTATGPTPPKLLTPRMSVKRPSAAARVWRIDGSPLVTPLPPGRPFDDAFSVVAGDRLVRVAGGDGRPAGPPIEMPTDDLTTGVSADGKLVAIGSGQRFEPTIEPKVIVASVATGKPIGPPMPQTSFPDFVEISPDGRWVSVLWHHYNPERGMVRVWDPRTGQPAGPLLTHGRAVNTAHFDPSGKMLLTASPDGAVIVWDPFTGRELGPRIMHTAPASEALFSPDGKVILTRGGRQGVETLRLWDARTGKPLTLAMAHPGAGQAAFSADGRFVVSSGNGVIRLWLAATGDLLSPPIRGTEPRWHSRAARLLINASSDHPLMLDLDRAAADAPSLPLAAQALAARHVDATGVLTELDLGSLRSVLRAVR